MKIKDITIEEFIKLPTNLKISYYNTLAKRTNRQVREYKKKGESLELFPELAKSNVKMIRAKEAEKILKKEERKPESTDKMLTERFATLKNITHGGITRENIKRLEEDKKNVEQILGKKLTGEQYYTWKKSEVYARTASAMYYEILKYGVEHGYTDSNGMAWGYDKTSQPSISPSDYAETIEKINDFIADTYGDEAVTIENMDDLRYAAQEFKTFTDEGKNEAIARRLNIFVKG